MMSRLRERISGNLAAIHERMARAAERSGRTGSDVLLVAVTKYVGPEIACHLPAAGCRNLGENRPQALWDKAEALRDEPIRWHMIGHVQRNKVHRTLPLLAWMHAADSVRLLDALEREAARQDLRPQVLLEFNVSEDPEKHGFRRADSSLLASRLAGWPHLAVRGLMAMSARASDAETARRDFAALRETRDAMQTQCPTGVRLEHLSMGMSRDYETAIEEGATMVRIGSALFEGIVV